MKHECLKLKLRVFLSSHTVAMVTYSVMKMITTCVPIIEQFFDTMIVASIDNEWNNDTSKSTSWKVLGTALRHPYYAGFSRH